MRSVCVTQGASNCEAWSRTCHGTTPQSSTSQVLIDAKYQW